MLNVVGNARQLQQTNGTNGLPLLVKMWFYFSLMLKKIMRPAGNDFFNRDINTPAEISHSDQK